MTQTSILQNSQVPVITLRLWINQIYLCSVIQSHTNSCITLPKFKTNPLPAHPTQDNRRAHCQYGTVKHCPQDSKLLIMNNANIPF